MLILPRMCQIRVQLMKMDIIMLICASTQQKSRSDTPTHARKQASISINLDTFFVWLCAVFNVLINTCRCSDGAKLMVRNFTTTSVCVDHYWLHAKTTGIQWSSWSTVALDIDQGGPWSRESNVNCELYTSIFSPTTVIKYTQCSIHTKLYNEIRQTDLPYSSFALSGYSFSHLFAIRCLFGHRPTKIA